jgi:hypothetical protein
MPGAGSQGRPRGPGRDRATEGRGTPRNAQDAVSARPKSAVRAAVRTTRRAAVRGGRDTGAAGRATTDFPFKAEDDPAKGFLGPIGWWWNAIYVSMFNRSALMMVMFGWELFLTPILCASALVAGVLEAAMSPLRRRRQEPGSV